MPTPVTRSAHPSRVYTSLAPLEAVSVTVPVGSIRIESGDVATAQVSLAPEVADDEAADQAIAEATITEVGGSLAVTVPHRPAADGASGVTGSTVIAGGVGQIIQATGGSITVAGGRVVSGTGLVMVPSGAVEAVLTVPAQVRLLLDGQDVAITATGPAGQVTASSVNGSIHLERAETVVAITANGAVQIGEAANVEATTTNGSVRIGLVTDSAVLRATNGSIRARTTTSDFSARSLNGNVEVHAEGVSLPDSAVRTTHGLARVR